MFRAQQEIEVVKGIRYISNKNCKCLNIISFKFYWKPTHYEKRPGKGDEFELLLDNDLGFVPLWMRVDSLKKNNQNVDKLTTEHKYFFGFRQDEMPKKIKKILWKVSFCWPDNSMDFTKICFPLKKKSENKIEIGQVYKTGIMGKNLYVTIKIYLERPKIAAGASAGVEISLYNKFEELRSSGCLTDVKLVCEGKEFLCHSIVLAAMSKVFQTMLSEKCENSSNKAILIEDFKKEELEIAIKFMYTHEQDKIEGDARRLLIFADKYDIEILRVACLTMCESQFSCEN